MPDRITILAVRPLSVPARASGLRTIAGFDFEANGMRVLGAALVASPDGDIHVETPRLSTALRLSAGLASRRAVAFTDDELHVAVASAALAELRRMAGG